MPNSALDDLLSIPEVDAALNPPPMAAPERAMTGVATRLKAQDLARRGIAHFTTPGGAVKEITDPAGKPLTGYDKKNQIAWDSAGEPQKISFDAELGTPKTVPAYADAPDFTDPRGDIYKRPAGLPWKQVGEDADIKTRIADRQRAGYDREADAALAPYEQEARTRFQQAHTAARASRKATVKSLAALGVPMVNDLKEPVLDPDDTPAARAHIESSFNREYGSPEANASPFMGGGKYSPAAEQLRADIDRRKAEAMRLADSHGAAAQGARGARTSLDAIKAQRNELRAGRLARTNAQRETAGLPPLVIPGVDNATGAGEGVITQSGELPATSFPVSDTPGSNGPLPDAETGFLPDPAAPAIPDAAPSDAPKDTSFLSAFLQGIDQPLEGIGTTAEVFGAERIGRLIKGLTDAPQNYESAGERFMNPREGDTSLFGFAPAYAPRALVEQAGQLAGSIGSRITGAAAGAAIGGTFGSAVPVAGTTAGALTGGTVGSFAGPFLFGAMQIAGPTAIERAKNNGRPSPNAEDMAVALATASGSGALDSLGAQFLPGGSRSVGPLLKKLMGTLFTGAAGTARKGATEAADSATKKILTSMFGEGVTEGAQSLVEQTGETGGTEKGLSVDLHQAVGEGLLGAGTGGVVGGAAAGWDRLKGPALPGVDDDPDAEAETGAWPMDPIDGDAGLHDARSELRRRGAGRGRGV